MPKYDNAYRPASNYGKALDLLVRHGQGHARDDRPAVHLDLGSGYGRIAEGLVQATGVDYVGVDVDGKAVASLRERGFEAHEAALGDYDRTLSTLRQIARGRRIASITLLDVIEHLPDATGALSAVGEIAAQDSALVVVSVPNVTHSDVGLKLVFGRWDVTETGLLDSKHVRFFARSPLERYLRACGLYKFDEANVELAQSDQHFPATHPALGERTSLHGYLTALRRSAESDDLVNQFVWICSPGPKAQVHALMLAREPEQPFLSIVVRTQGNRTDCLREVLTCLAAQSCQDFEVVVVAHRVNVDQQVEIERLIEDTPGRLRERIRLVLLDHGSRSAPLNVGFQASRGRYISILDDDDVVFGHWVETFRSMERRAAGRMLRTISVPQRADHVAVFGRGAARATGPLIAQYPESFDFLEHLRDNYTPNTAVAFPRGVFHDLGQHFDEELSTTEDWDFMMRVASIVGVDSSPTVTCIYRWWTSRESSRTVHDRHEWLRNNGAIFKKFDESQILFPAGSARRVREVLQEIDQLRAALSERDAMVPPPPTTHLQPRMDRLREIQSILDSTSWRVTAPLRLLSRVVGRGQRVVLEDYFDRSDAALVDAVAHLRASRSWTITSLFRR